MAAQSKTWVCGHSLARIVGSNPAEGMDTCLLWLVCCHVEVSASGWSLIWTSPTQCGVSEYDREARTMRPWPTTGCRAMKKKSIVLVKCFVRPPPHLPPPTTTEANGIQRNVLEKISPKRLRAHHDLNIHRPYKMHKRVWSLLCIFHHATCGIIYEEGTKRSGQLGKYIWPIYFCSWMTIERLLLTLFWPECKRKLLELLEPTDRNWSPPPYKLTRWKGSFISRRPVRTTSATLRGIHCSSNTTEIQRNMLVWVAHAPVFPTDTPQWTNQYAGFEWKQFRPPPIYMLYSDVIPAI